MTTFSQAAALLAPVVQAHLQLPLAQQVPQQEVPQQEVQPEEVQPQEVQPQQNGVPQELVRIVARELMPVVKAAVKEEVEVVQTAMKEEMEKIAGKLDKLLEQRQQESKQENSRQWTWKHLFCLA